MRLVPFADAEAEAALAVLPAAERYAAFHTRAGGRLRSATAAAREVLLCLPAGRAAVALGLHRAYPLIARHRRALGRLVPRLPVTRTPPR
jgi:hypothetical protein